MAWYKTTYDEVETRLRARIPGLKDVALWNNQVDDLKGDVNEEYPWNMPAVFPAFGGGEWTREPNGNRRSTDYEFRLHVCLARYDDQLDHLDDILAYINALDDWKGATHVERFDLVEDAIDDERTNVIHHVLTFRALVCDGSLAQELAPATAQATAHEINRG